MGQQGLMVNKTNPKSSCLSVVAIFVGDMTSVVSGGLTVTSFVAGGYFYHPCYIIHTLDFLLHILFDLLLLVPVFSPDFDTHKTINVFFIGEMMRTGVLRRVWSEVAIGCYLLKLQINLLITSLLQIECMAVSVACQENY